MGPAAIEVTSAPVEKQTLPGFTSEGPGASVDALPGVDSDRYDATQIYLPPGGGEAPSPGGIS